MSKGITYVGLDVHQDTIVAAVLLPRRKQPEIFKCRNEDAAVRRFVRKLKDRAPGRIESCYEAGPTGFHLVRLLETCGVGCVVIAPSLIPSRPGERVKTDRRDAEKLAKLLRAQLLTEVHPPSEATRPSARRHRRRPRRSRRSRCPWSRFHCRLHWPRRNIRSSPARERGKPMRSLLLARRRTPSAGIVANRAPRLHR